jgi:membrane dipeptidase
VTDLDFGVFDFGLAQDQEDRARKLHADAVIVDMLFQGPCSDLAFDEELMALVGQRRKDMRFAPGTNDWVLAAREAPIRAALTGDERLRTHWEQSGVVGGNRQLSIGVDLLDTHIWALTQAQCDALPWLIKGLCAGDFRAAKERGQRVGFLSCQDTGGLDPTHDPYLDRFHDLYEFGLRVVGLTYNMQNSVGGGCTERTDTGISNFGARLIERANELGVIVDTAHSGRRTTLDACELSAQPVIASHTAAAGVYKHDRGKTDEQLTAIAQTGGLIGIVAAPFFLGSADAAHELTVSTMFEHLDYVAELVGWEHVGIGTDWPMQMDQDTLRLFVGNLDRVGFRDDHKVTATTLAGFRDYRDFPNITRGLVARGYTDEQIKGILGENFLRVFEQVCG